jgi:hypothetical protein
MQKKKEKQHARGKATCKEEDKLNHIRVRFFIRIVMATILKKSINKNLGGLGQELVS